MTKKHKIVIASVIKYLTEINNPNDITSNWKKTGNLIIMNNRDLVRNRGRIIN